MLIATGPMQQMLAAALASADVAAPANDPDLITCPFIESLCIRTRRLRILFLTPKLLPVPRFKVKGLFRGGSTGSSLPRNAHYLLARGTAIYDVAGTSLVLWEIDLQRRSFYG